MGGKASKKKILFIIVFNDKATFKNQIYHFPGWHDLQFNEIN